MAPVDQPRLLDLIWSDYTIVSEVNAVLREAGRPTGSDEEESPSRWKAPRRFLLNPSLRAALLFRLCARAGRMTSWFWESALLTLHSSQVMPGASIGAGLRLPHPYGICIANGVVLGENVTIAHHVTLGSDRSWSGQPCLEDGVTVLSGSVVAGPITIGKGAVIGANCVVREDIEPGGLATAPKTRIAKARVDRD